MGFCFGCQAYWVLVIACLRDLTDQGSDDEERGQTAVDDKPRRLRAGGPHARCTGHRLHTPSITNYSSNSEELGIVGKKARGVLVGWRVSNTVSYHADARKETRSG